MLDFQKYVKYVRGDSLKYCDERPEASSASPWKQARNTCPSSSQADWSQLQLITRRLHKPRKPYHKGDTSPWDWALTRPLISFSQIAACDRPAPQEHPTDSLHWKEEGEHSAQRSTHVDFSLVSLPPFVINPPSGGHLLSNPCRVIPHPVTLVENASILVKNHRQAISFTLPFLFFFVFGFCHRRALLPQHGWNPPAAHRG